MSRERAGADELPAPIFSKGNTMLSWNTVASVSVLLCVCAVVYAFIVWIRRNDYTKERFAFAALTSGVSLTMVYIAAVTSGLMPLSIVEAGVRWAISGEFNVAEPTTAEQLLLFLAWAGSLYFISRMFDKWDGLRSVQQYRLEQRKDTMVLIVEGLKEAQRIVRREGQLPIHEEPRGSRVLEVRIQAGDSISWPERARDLVQIKWRRYDFSDGSRQERGCYIGANRETGAPVVLECPTNAPDDAAVQEILQYAERVGSSRGNPQVEIIVAVEADFANGRSREADAHLHFVSEAALLDELVNWTDYREEIRRRVTTARLPDSDLTIQDVFVEPSFEPIHWTLDGSSDLAPHLLDWLQESGRRHLALLGDYGQGKSTAALALTYRLMKPGASVRIPILIELRGRSPRNLTPLELLGAWSSRYHHVDPRALWHLHLAGRLLLIFEGFDEMALVGDADARFKHFRTLWEFSHPRAKILITGRPNFFLDDKEMMRALGIGDPIRDEPYCRAMALEPFGLRQIRRALRAHDDSIKTEVCRFAEENEQFRELVSRPSLLHIVAGLWRREDLSSQLERLTSAYVMKLFIRHSYSRQGQKEEESREFMALNSAEREYFMKGVATYMAANRLPNQISGAQMNEAVVALVDAIPDSVSSRTSAIVSEVSTPLKKRIAEAEQGLEQVQTDVRTCGILVNDPAAPGSFRFGHKSFMEYLFAEVLGDVITENDDPASAAILDACNASASDVASLPVSVRFLSEIIRENMCGLRGPAGNEVNVARRILRLLYGESVLAFWLGRVVLYDLSLRRLWLSWPLYRRVLLPVPLFSSGGLTALGVIVANAALAAGGLGRLREEVAGLVGVMAEGGILVVLLAAVSFLAASVGGTLVAVRMTPRNTSSRLDVWNRLCRELGFEDRVLYRVAGIWWAPWTGDRPFDFLLDRE